VPLSEQYPVRVLGAVLLLRSQSLLRALERRRAQALGARHAPQCLADILLHKEHDEPSRQQFAEQTVDATQPSLTLRS